MNDWSKQTCVVDYTIDGFPALTFVLCRLSNGPVMLLTSIAVIFIAICITRTRRGNHCQSIFQIIFRLEVLLRERFEGRNWAEPVWVFCRAKHLLHWQRIRAKISLSILFFIMNMQSRHHGTIWPIQGALYTWFTLGISVEFWKNRPYSDRLFLVEHLKIKYFGTVNCLL